MVPETFPESFVPNEQCALGTNLSLSRRTNLTLNLPTQIKSKVISSEKQPENFQLHPYWNLSNVSLIPTMTVEKRRHFSFGAYFELKIKGYKKELSIIYTSSNEKIENAKSPWMFTLPIQFVDYNKINGKYLYYLFKIFFHSAITLDYLLFGHQQLQTFHIFKGCFVVVKAMLIYDKILLSTKILRPLLNMNLKIFRVACHHSIQKICRQNRLECWHRQCYPSKRSYS